MHVWTTGDNEDTVYDNGAWITDGKDDTTPENDVRHFGMAEIDQYDGDEYNGEKNVTYGTYTRRTSSSLRAMLSLQDIL